MTNSAEGSDSRTQFDSGVNNNNPTTTTTINIGDYFQGNINGSLVSKFYQDKQYLDDHHRNLLSDCIISAEISKTSDYR